MHTHPINDTLSDGVLMSYIAQGSEPALCVLMQRYKHKLYAFISRYVKDADTAYDILQEVFIRVHFKADSYNPDYAFSTWLYHIAINMCRDMARKEKIRQIFSLDSKEDNEGAGYYDTIPDSGAVTEDIVELRRNLSVLDKAIQRLPHKLKTALILFAVEEYSQEKCAELLGVTAKTVETRVYRARKILAEQLANPSRNFIA